ncbi:hypothetical protein P4B35_18640 [Pontiellaceae bacterium B12227]|nr:hypothetical protein [Pontiellaceae bacterium B12227]
MIKHNVTIGLVAVALVGSVTFCSTYAQEASAESASTISSQAQAAIANAEVEVEKARVAIEAGKQIIAQIPSDSPLMPDVAQVVEAASENWKIAIDSLKGAKESASKIGSATNESIANDYALLAKVNAGVALSGAKVVQIALTYIDAIAAEKTEALDIIRTAMQDALASSSQVQFNYERVKTLIAQKYSK